MSLSYRTCTNSDGRKKQRTRNQPHISEFYLEATLTESVNKDEVTNIPVPGMVMISEHWPGVI